MGQVGLLAADALAYRVVCLILLTLKRRIKRKTYLLESGRLPCARGGSSAPA